MFKGLPKNDVEEDLGSVLKSNNLFIRHPLLFWSCTSVMFIIANSGLDDVSVPQLKWIVRIVVLFDSFRREENKMDR